MEEEKLISRHNNENEEERLLKKVDKKLEKDITAVCISLGLGAIIISVSVIGLVIYLVPKGRLG